jgi:hypothetical protein
MSHSVTQRFVKCLDKLREDKRVRSNRQFALSLDYLPQSLSEILKGRRDVTIELLRKAVEVYQFSPVYLFCGEGPLFMPSQDQSDFRLLTVVTDKNDAERIVHVPEPALAGYAGERPEPSFFLDLPTFSLPDARYNTDTHRSFDVAGDSMEPTLFDGDKVVCSFIDPKHWESAIKNNYIYVIVTRSDVLVKRLVNNIRTERSLELHADNEFYKPFTVQVSDVREIWYVRVKISSFLPSPQKILEMTYSELKELRNSSQEQHELIKELLQIARAGGE